MAAGVKLQTTVSLSSSPDFELERPKTRAIPYLSGFLTACGMNPSNHESARQLPLKRMEASRG